MSTSGPAVAKRNSRRRGRRLALDGRVDVPPCPEALCGTPRGPVPRGPIPDPQGVPHLYEPGPHHQHHDPFGKAHLELAQLQSGGLMTKTLAVNENPPPSPSTVGGRPLCPFSSRQYSRWRQPNPRESQSLVVDWQDLAQPFTCFLRRKRRCRRFTYLMQQSRAKEVLRRLLQACCIPSAHVHASFGKEMTALLPQLRFCNESRISLGQ